MNVTAVILIACVVIVGVGIIIAMMFRVKPQCPECDSKDIVETNRETLGSRMIETAGGGTPGGGSIRLQLEFEVTYRCKNCGEIFKHKFSETQ